MTSAHAPLYSDYASIYDAIGQAWFGSHMAQLALRWLDAAGAKPRHVLDLACGTGAASLIFAAAGCAVVAVDQSAAMLEIARARARDACHTITFVHGDIRDLSNLGQRRPAAKQIIGEPRSTDDGRELFDLATCFYDSLNYLVDAGDLSRVFAGVASVLAPGGYVMFDINTEIEYSTWDERDVVTHDGNDYLVYNHLDYDPRTRLATGRIVWFVREIDRWWRGEETHTMRAWSDAEVREGLQAAGLASILRLTPEGTPALDESPRVVYVARKPGPVVAREP